MRWSPSSSRASKRSRSARRPTRTPRWARSSPRRTATRSSATSTTASKQGAELVVDGRGFKLQGYEGGYYVGGTLFDHVTPDMTIYKEEIFGPVLSVVRANDLQRRGRPDQRPRIRQRHRHLHPRRRRRPRVRRQDRSRHGRHQRADPGAGRLPLLRRLEALAVRRPLDLRPRRRALLHAAQDRDDALAGPREHQHGGCGTFDVPLPTRNEGGDEAPGEGPRSSIRLDHEIRSLGRDERLTVLVTSSASSAVPSAVLRDFVCRRPGVEVDGGNIAPSTMLAHPLNMPASRPAVLEQRRRRLEGT